ncbi:caspase, EACC1-associated type [Streptomyces physcomitrii]|uniref:Protein kinase n=1 Tax=Streptomyces physcomitrii TaxID=2724184 RepID=A0ABX1H8R6_9ACTN|nr:esterase-like activity of phytase family protein [Streptomyces physcomitrii]NKI44735.1 protein kinase [Streptomyces physcomitrii]
MTGVPAPGQDSADVDKGRVDPARSVCLLVGVDDYETLERLTSVIHNLARLAEIFRDKDIGGFPEDRVILLANPREATDLTDAIERAGERAEDTLLVYYAGHGLLSTENRLYLTLPKSRPARPEGWVNTTHIRDAIERSAARRIVLILDCCFSGGWVRQGEEYSGINGADLALGTLDELSTGTYTLASAPHNRRSHAPHADRPSAFTGALVDTLTTGDPEGGETLSLGSIFVQVRRRVLAMRLPESQEPQARDENGLADLGLVLNAARRPAPPPPEPVHPPAPLARRKLLLCATAGLALGVLGTLLAPPLAHRLDPGTPQHAYGDCSPDAALLDHSDALDKTETDSEAVEGLSGLSFAPGQPGKLYAVTDNEPTRIFPLGFGTAEKLTPKAGRARTLRGGEGSQGLGWLDAEALAVEKGARTALVAAETGPTLRRFSLESGLQVGKALPLPSTLSTWPEGGAQTGRTLESLAITPKAEHLYLATEAPLAQDGDERGRGLIRIQRFTGTPNGDYRADEEFAYRTDPGLNLVELVAVDEDRLLALERQYTEGLGNAIRVKDISLRGAADVSREKSLYQAPADVFLHSTLLFDLADCPAGSPGEVAPAGVQANPLLGNVEGMALGSTLTDGPHEGRRSLFLVTDDNGSKAQITRLYSMAVAL